MSWIKLQLHPDSPKVAIVAQEIGASKAEAYVAMLRWLFWLDENHGEDGVTVSPAMFKAATGWPNDKLAAVFQTKDVDWLTAAGDRLAPTRPDSHFSESAKIRAQDSMRKAKARKRTRCGQEADTTRTSVREIRDMTVTRGEERRGEEREETVAVAAGVGDEVQEKGGTQHGMTAEQHAVYTRIVARPLWLPQDRDWIEPTTARGLALRDTSTPAHVAYWLDRARARRKEARDVNLAGYVIGKLEKPDLALVESLASLSGANNP